MKNIEKYKNFVLDKLDICDIDSRLRRMDNGFCSGFSCEGCEERFLKWLLEECKEPVLDDVERKYLSEVIKPFKLYIRSIVKYPIVQEGCDREFICVRFVWGAWQFPSFKKGAMYKGMKLHRDYTLEELGL